MHDRIQYMKTKHKIKWLIISQIKANWRAVFLLLVPTTGKYYWLRSSGQSPSTTCTSSIAALTASPVSWNTSWLIPLSVKVVWPKCHSSSPIPRTLHIHTTKYIKNNIAMLLLYCDISRHINIALWLSDKSDAVIDGSRHGLGGGG